jgi:hypothetical protein
MSKKIPVLPEFVTLAKCGREIGVATATAGKLLPWIWVGQRRLVPRRSYEAWKAERLVEAARREVDQRTPPRSASGGASAAA